jgi:glycosyltransferase involved in cell wall biosynthesis
MRITFLLPGDSRSGGARVTMQMGNCLLNRGHRVRIAYRTPAVFSREQLVSCARSVKYRLQGISETGWLSYFRGEKEPFVRLEDLHFWEKEVVIATGEHTIPGLNNLKADVRKLRYCHGLIVRDPEQMRLAWSGPTPTIAVSRGLAPTLEEYHGRPILGIVPNGIDQKEYFVESRMRDGIGFIFHGSPLKGSEVAGALINGLHRTFPGTRCHIFGSYPRPSELTPSEYTRYPSIDKAREIYNRCKIWMVTSRDEGFCLPILEAMACGCSVISSRHTNARELIQDGVNGFTISYGDVDGYLKLVARLLNDESLRERVVEEGLRTVNRFSWDLAADRMEEALRRLSDANSRPRSASAPGPVGTSAAVGTEC